MKLVPHPTRPTGPYRTWPDAALAAERTRLALAPVLRRGPQSQRAEAVEAEIEERKWRRAA